jgi:hypothetical protein
VTEEAISTAHAIAVQESEPKANDDWKQRTAETVLLLSQQKPDDRIEVEIELGELDLTSAESKATYEEIQDYVDVWNELN